MLGLFGKKDHKSIVWDQSRELIGEFTQVSGVQAIPVQLPGLDYILLGHGWDWGDMHSELEAEALAWRDAGVSFAVLCCYSKQCSKNPAYAGIKFYDLCDERVWVTSSKDGSKLCWASETIAKKHGEPAYWE